MKQDLLSLRKKIKGGGGNWKKRVLRSPYCIYERYSKDGLADPGAGRGKRSAEAWDEF